MDNVISEDDLIIITSGASAWAVATQDNEMVMALKRIGDVMSENDGEAVVKRLRNRWAEVRKAMILMESVLGGEI